MKVDLACLKRMCKVKLGQLVPVSPNEGGASWPILYSGLHSCARLHGHYGDRSTKRMRRGGAFGAVDTSTWMIV